MRGLAAAAAVLTHPLCMYARFGLRLDPIVALVTDSAMLFICSYASCVCVNCGFPSRILLVLSRANIAEFGRMSNNLQI